MKKTKILLTVLAISSIASLVACASGSNTSVESSSIVVSSQVSSSSEESSSVVSSSEENVKTLKSVEAKLSADAKISYVPGEVFSLDGVSLEFTYSNTTMEDTKESVSDLSDYDVVIKDSEGNVTPEKLLKFGQYSVTIANGDISAMYTIEVVPDTLQTATVEDAVNTARVQKNLVGNGTLSVKEKYDAYTSSYVFGKDYLTVSTLHDGSETPTKTFVGLYDDGEDSLVYSLEDSGNGYVKPYDDPTEENLNGPQLSLFSYYEYRYGIEDTISYLYDEASAQEGFTSSITTNDKNEKVYGFDFSIEVSGATFSGSVSFVLTDYGTIGSATITSNSTYSEYSATVTQNVDYRNEENPMPYEELFVDDFKLLDAEGKEVTNETVISGTINKSVSLKISDVTPETANLKYDEIGFLYNDNFNSYVYDSMYTAYIEGNNVIITPKKGGEFTVTVITNYVNKVIHFNVIQPDPTTITPTVFDSSSYEYVEKTTYEAYCGAEVTIAANVDSGAKEGFVASLPADTDGATLKDNDGSYTFKATKAGTYVVTIKSTVVETVTNTLTITVKDAPKLEEVLPGTWKSSDDTTTVEATKDSENENAGTLEITYTDEMTSESATYSYLVDTTTNTVTFTKVSGDDFTIEVNENYNLVVADDYGWPIEVVKQSESENALSGKTYSGSGYTFVFDDETFTVTYSGQSATYSYTIDGSAITFNGTPVEGKNVFNNAEPYLTGSGTYDSTNDSIVFKGMMGNVTLTLGEGTEDDGLVIGENEVTFTYSGSAFNFTAKEAGEYTFSISEDTEGVLATDGWCTDPVTSLTETLEANETYTFFGFTNEEDIEVVITISKKDDGLKLGDNTVSFSGYDPYTLSFTATEAGDYTISVSADGVDASVTTTDDDWFNNASSSMNVTLTAGETYSFYMMAMDDVDVTVTIAKGASEEKSKELALGDNDITVTFFGETFTFTPTKSGNYKFDSTNVAYYGYAYGESETGAGSFLLRNAIAGQPYEIVFMGNSMTSDDITLTVSLDTTLVVGDNEIYADGSVGTTFTFKATKAGTYNISFSDTEVYGIDVGGNFSTETVSVNLTEGETLTLIIIGYDQLGGNNTTVTIALAE